jgi:hypothetical protein
MEFHGVPLHPLVVHAAVVFTPLAALATLAFVVVGRWRELLRWPTAVLAVLATGACWTARITGRSLFNKLTAQGLHNKWLTLHQQRGNVLVWIVLALAVLAVLAALVVPTEAGAARLSASPALVLGLRVVVVAVAIAALVYVYLTGDAGARALWAPTS